MKKGSKKCSSPILFVPITAFLAATLFATVIACDKGDQNSENPPTENSLSNPYADANPHGVEDYTDSDNGLTTDIAAQTYNNDGDAEASMHGITIHGIIARSDAIRFETSIDFSQNNLMHPEACLDDFVIFVTITMESDIEQSDTTRTIYSHFTADGESAIRGYFDIGIIGVDTSDDAPYRDGNTDFGALGNFVLVFSGYNNSEIRIPLTL